MMKLLVCYDSLINVRAIRVNGKECVEGYPHISKGELVPLLN